MTRVRLTDVKHVLAVLLAGAFVTGCASTNTIDARKKERATAYATLPTETKALVDAGEIRRGMPEDAVYIAWGKPAQILHSEDQNGAATVWLYEGGWMEETRYWTCRWRTPVTDYQPRTYVRAEIVFVGGKVDSWRTLPQPLN